VRLRHRALAAVAAAAANTANSGTNLADKTTTEAAMHRQERTCNACCQANTALTVLAITNLTDNRWFKRWQHRCGDDQVGDRRNHGVSRLRLGIPSRRRCRATSTTLLSGQQALRRNRSAALLTVDALKGTAVASTFAAISTATGTAADPGTTKARVDADLTVFANNVATIAARINACISAPTRRAAVAATYVA
jgi:hypothetical protein